MVMDMFGTIRKIRQFCIKINCRCRKIKNEMERQRVLNEMQEAGIIIL